MPRIQVETTGWDADDTPTGNNRIRGYSRARTSLEIISSFIEQISSKNWDRLPITMQQERSRHGAVVLSDNRILVTGGEDGVGSPLDSVEIIDTNNPPNTTTTIPNMTSTLFRHASVLINKNVYIIGGYATNRTYLKSVADFDAVVIHQRGIGKGRNHVLF